MPVSDQGVTCERYMLIPRVLIFITRGSRILLLRGAPTKHLWANRYNGIGGHVERGEDILTAARRELMEEAGLSTDLWLCGTLVVETDKNPGIGIYVFTGESKQGEPTPTEEGTLEWVDFHKVVDLPCVEDLAVLIERIRIMKRADPPFSARSYYDANNKLLVKFA